jgi:hypothetical protein
MYSPSPPEPSSQYTPPRMQPRFVPTLTEVVHVPVSPSASPQHEVLSVEQQELLIHRVMQRVDAAVSRRLSDALTELVSAHTARLIPLLHQEIEAVVRTCVSEAIAQELHGQST